ncbi:MAG: hypothetical protein M5U28_34340 [Sandaracinaceae bacterium]|nr:hypothetical protein [Sandaracinaceae bacterium]
MTVAAWLLALLLVWLVPERSREAVYSAARREPGSSVGAGLSSRSRCRCSGSR